MNNARQVLQVGSFDGNDRVNTFLLSWSLGKPERVADESGGPGVDIARIGAVDMSALVEARFVVGVKAASVDAVSAIVAAAAAELASLSPITIGLKNSAHTGTLIPRIAECIELPQEAPWDTRLVNGATRVELVVRRDPYVLAATEKRYLAADNFPAALPISTTWPVDWTVATYPANTPVVALRFDDGTSYDWDYTVPMLAERGLVAGFAVNNYRIDGHVGYTTTAQFLKAESLGNEIMCHSRNHIADPATPAEFYDETVTATAELIALGFNVRSFVQPGSWVAAYNINFDSGWTVGCAADLVLRANFAAYEGYLYGWYAPLPVSGERRYGKGHLSPTTAAGAISAVDALISNAAAGTLYGVEMLFHSNAIPGGMGWTDFGTVLDYIVAKVASDDIAVLTPTQFHYAVPS